MTDQHTKRAGTLAGLAVGLFSMWGLARFLVNPDSALDWVVVLASSITIGIFAFFLVWGHLQKDPGEA